MSAIRPTGRLSHSGMLATESPLRDLESIIRSRTPLIAVESNEEPQIVRLVREIGRRLQLRGFRWTVTEGLQAFDPNDQPPVSILKSQEVLSHIRTTANNSYFVLLDFHPYLQDAVHVRHLKDIALSYAQHYSTVIIVGCSVLVPEELRPFTAQFRLPLPTLDELRGIVLDVAGEWGAEHGRRDVQTTNKALEMLVRNLGGLTVTDARRLAAKAITDDGVIAESDIPRVMQAKYELLGRDSPLSFEYETAKFSEIGGMQRLRKWIEMRKSFFVEGGETHLDPPRGVLLLGVQGCGKSLAAKAAAGILGVPLLRLDFGVLYNKYYGETERNLRKALETAEVMSPCVLWMDEIEKGLAVGDDDDGLARRILGTLLTWMSERHQPVFVVATANDIMRLPPEMVRKGRFDEIFFVDLPSPANRREILEIHLRKRCLNPGEFQLEPLSAATDGFSGSEIEQAIVSAMYTAHAQGRTVSQEDLLEEIRQTRPLSIVMAERVGEIREWAAGRTVPCD
ncbi:MAG TPA: AAA family ATPase [Verrucomicrobiae bacterium]|nr:AAA family ATPase [Verrucomicrobiae bacterium]